MKKELNSVEIKKKIDFVIKRNIELANEGKLPIALEIEGMPGTAKTSVVKQASIEHDCHFVRINLAECEPADLIGLPIYEYEIKKGSNFKWISDKVLTAFVNDGWNPTGEHRTSYSKPVWIHGKEDKPIILTLDDYNRCSPLMTNACMTLIDEQKYISWGLPKGSTIILTCNPSDQDFFVQAEDSAQNTRRLKLYMKADVEAWARWAEGYGIDERAINFMLKHPEIIEGAVTKNKEDGEVLAKGNLRIWTKYFDMIGGIKNFEDEMDTIIDLGSGSLPKEHIQLFVTFIKNKLDLLPSIKDLLEKDTKWSIEKLKEVVKEGPSRRQDISSIITKRLLNYAIVNEKSYSKDMIENYANILESDYISKDLAIISVRTLTTKPKFKDIAIRPKIFQMIAGS